MKKLMILMAGMAVLLTVSVRGDESAALAEPVKSVYDHYLKIQKELVHDSLKGIRENAGTIAKTVREDPQKTLPLEVARRAEELAKSSDLAEAREALKKLSEPLIRYLADHQVHSGDYNEIYCSMAKASWLQSGKEIGNPYLGSSMPTCGELKRSF